MCCVWIWEQTAIISLYSINWLVRRSVFTARYELDLYIQFRLILVLKGLRYSQGEFANTEPSGRYMYPQFNIQQHYVLPT